MEKIVPKIGLLFDVLNQSGVDYCHWKSNVNIEIAICGKMDLDLLVNRKQKAKFEMIISDLGFKAVSGPDWESHPYVFHYYGLDGKGDLIDLHVYYRIITGGGLLKNYLLPIENMLIQKAVLHENIRIPEKAAELVVFVIRKMLEHTSIAEYILLRREYSGVKKEIQWLYDENSGKKAIELVQLWLPCLDVQLFLRCLHNLRSDKISIRLFILGQQVKASLKAYTMHSGMWCLINRNYRLIRKILNRFSSYSGVCRLSGGGCVVAFVGPEATGKSTHISELSNWLGKYFIYRSFHIGKPPTTWLSFLPNTLLPLLRNILPNSRSTKVESIAPILNIDKYSKKPLLYMIRATLLGFDRRNIIMCAYKEAAHGAIVLCDRYPASQRGAVDSSQLNSADAQASYSFIRSLLIRAENKFYAQIPSADLVVKLSVPVDIAIKRNAQRIKKGSESEDFIRLRHSQSSKLVFERSPVLNLDTTKPFELTLLEVKKAIWELL